MMAEVLLFGVLSFVVFKGFTDAMAVVTAWGFCAFAFLFNIFGGVSNTFFMLFFLITIATIVLSVMFRSYGR